MLKAGIILLINIIFIVSITFIQIRYRKIKFSVLITLSSVFLVGELMFFIVPTLNNIIKDIGSFTIENNEIIALIIEFAGFALSVYLEVKNDKRLKSEYNNLYFDNLTIANPDFDNNSAELILASNDVKLPTHYSVVFDKITIYIILIPELFENEDLFNKYKDNNRYVRTVSLTEIKFDPSDIERTNKDTLYHIKEFNSNFEPLKDILKNNAIKYKDKTMIRTTVNYKLIDSPKFLIGKLEQFIISILHHINDNTNSVFEMKSCSNNRFIYSKPKYMGEQDEK